MAAHAKPTEQNLFAIIQGGLDPELRKNCIKGTVYCMFTSVIQYNLV